MSDNPKHYTSETPCKKCRGRTRYKSTDNCVPCAKAAVQARRTRLAEIANNVCVEDPRLLGPKVQAALLAAPGPSIIKCSSAFMEAYNADRAKLDTGEDLL